MANLISLDQQVDLVRQRFGDLILEKDRVGCPVFWVSPDRLIEFLKFLKNQDGLEFRFLVDLCGYDDMGSPFEKQGRFVIVYQLYSPQYKTRVRVKCRVADKAEVPTTVGLWAAANWAEREVFDMFGVRFTGHPDLRRILMDERWEGHPLRKDYPARKYQIFTDAEQVPMHLLKE